MLDDISALERKKKKQQQGMNRSDIWQVHTRAMQ